MKEGGEGWRESWREGGKEGGRERGRKSEILEHLGEDDEEVEK